MKLSIVIPVYNEEDSLPELFTQLRNSLEAVAREAEVILVDDGSADASFAGMKRLAAGDRRFRLVRFRRNYGQTAAMSAGFDAATGDVIVTMDADLQNDPADIPLLLDKLDQGYDVVSGWRKNRQDRLLSRRLPSVLANRLISRLTGVHLNDYGCTLKAYRKAIISDVNLYGELHRFVPVLAAIVGGRVTEVSVNHRARLYGQSKYGIGRTTRVVLDLLTVKFLLQYATRPMQLFGKWGLYTLVASGLVGAATLYMKFFEQMSINRNPLFILCIFLFFGGVHFLVLGLLGEMITRTYHETQKKSIYNIAETVN